MDKPLIRWHKDTFAESAWLGEWYLGAIFCPAEGHFVLNLSLPDKRDRTEHSTREGAKEFAEHRVREFLAFAQLPGRI